MWYDFFNIKICKISSIKLKCEGTFGGQCIILAILYLELDDTMDEMIIRQMNHQFNQIATGCFKLTKNTSHFFLVYIIIISTESTTKCNYSYCVDIKKRHNVKQNNFILQHVCFII